MTESLRPVPAFETARLERWGWRVASAEGALSAYERTPAETLDKIADLAPAFFAHFENEE